MLLAGYGYAHLPPSGSSRAHRLSCILFLTGALALLPITPADAGKQSAARIQRADSLVADELSGSAIFVLSPPAR